MSILKKGAFPSYTFCREKKKKLLSSVTCTLERTL